MNVRIIKEIRPLFPAFALTLGGLIIAFIFWNYSQTAAYWSLIASAFGCILMGVATFGDEISNRTMPLLLTQPFSRQTLWREKMTALALAMCVLLGVALIFLDLIVRFFAPEVVGVVLILIVFSLGVFCTVPFWTLAFRNIPAAMAGAIGMPFGLSLFAIGIFYHLPALKAYQDSMAVQAGFFLPIAMLYFSACYWAGRHVFLKMEALDIQGQDIALPEGMERSLVRPFIRYIPQFTGPWSSLINKELHLQKLDFIMAALFCIVVPLAYCAWKLSNRFDTWWLGQEIAVSVLGTTFAIYVILIPLIAGAGCIAEEKNWKIHEWHLTLPPSNLKQWIAKVLVAIGITLVLGILLPCIFLVIGNFWKPDFIYIALYPLSAVCLGIFASSISTNSFRAIILTLVLLGLAVGAAALGDAAAFFGPNAILHIADNPSVHVQEFGPSLGVLHILAIVLLSGTIGLTLYMSFLNYRTGTTSVRFAWIHSALILMAISAASFIFIFCTMLHTVVVHEFPR